MYVTLALAFAVASNGFTASSAQHEHTIEDVDWKEFVALLKVYFCSGNRNWYNKQISNRNEELMKVRVILSTVTVTVCKGDAYVTFLPIYQDIYIPLLRRYPTLRKCYGSALKMMISRLICCWEENKSFGNLTQTFRKLIKEDNTNASAIRVMSYLSRIDILNKIYTIARKLKICTSCPREEFRTVYERETRGSSRRVKRFYDITSWLHVLKTLSRLDINNVDIRNDKLDETWNVRSTRFLLFVGEGLIFCSTTYLLNSTVA